MKNLSRMAVAVLGMIILFSGAGTVWYVLDRTTMVQAVCRAGGPNLSRPRSVPSYMLGCAVLGPKQRIAGILQTSFENSTLLVDSEIQDPSGAIENEPAWFSTSSGIMGRGGATLRRRIDATPEGTCGVGLASVTVEGWMTVSEGEFGHLGGWDREFFADRIIHAYAPPAANVEEMREMMSRAVPSDICASMDTSAH
ncbi:MAG: hypothetical protein ACK4VY_04140 [Brevundimonas sp.]